MTVKKGLYDKVLKDLNSAGISENPFQWYALVIGVMSRGMESSGRILIQTLSNLLNDGEPLPGTIVATMTNLAMDLEDRLENADSDLFAMPDDSYDNSLRLKVLADICYGLSLGLTVNAQSGALEEKIKDTKLLEDLNTISEIARVDPESELDEEDLDNVLEFLIDVASRNYQLNQKG